MSHKLNETEYTNNSNKNALNNEMPHATMAYTKRNIKKGKN